MPQEIARASTSVSIVDTHAHLDMDSFNEDRGQVIARALESGVSTIITVGINLDSSRKAIKLAESHREILATTAGFHPHEAGRVTEEDMAELSIIARHSRVVAIGEIGLDFYRNHATREEQIKVLKRQLEIATELDLPVIIHCRQAERDMLPLLRNWASSDRKHQGQTRGVIHCFNSDGDTARHYLDMGFFISLGGYISYPSARQMFNTIRGIPEDRLVVETDCPFLPPQSHRGQRNEPAYVLATVKTLADIREVTAERVARETTQNAHRLFRIHQAEQ
ncbi:MAG: TatD family hydrolase [Dehalococcoidales bacterium]|nr:TatD family hydrolase [Dehalococcoidales bacterium]